MGASDLTQVFSALRKGMTRSLVLDTAELAALEKCVEAAWAIILPQLAADPRDDPRYHERLAKIVLDQMVAGHDPDEACARASAAKFLFGPR